MKPKTHKSIQGIGQHSPKHKRIGITQSQAETLPSLITGSISFDPELITKAQAQRLGIKPKAKSKALLQSDVNQMSHADCMHAIGIINTQLLIGKIRPMHADLLRANRIMLQRRARAEGEALRADYEEGLT